MPAPADRASHLSSVIMRLGGGADRTPDPAGDLPAAPASVNPTPRPAFVTGMTLQKPIGKLPYPAAVYRAAADHLREVEKDLATHQAIICVQEGPHVPGAGCPTVSIADLLRGVADTLDPPKPPEVPHVSAT